MRLKQKIILLPIKKHQMKKAILFLSLVTVTGSVFAQLKQTSSAVVSFDASTSLDNLPKAENKTVIAEIDTKTGTVGFEAAVKNFAFSNPMIQDHFNGANWLNSTEFPSFLFTGKITDLSKVNFAKDGSYIVPVTGDLTIKNVTKPVVTTATIIVNGATLNASTSFSIKLAEYGVSGVPIDAGKVAREPKITVSAELK
jgi:polyisoprenoid-binding protein YceI